MFESGNEEGEAPVIIPCFYRLSIQDLYKEPRVNSDDPNDKLMCEKSRFLEWQMNGEPEADVEKIKAALGALHGIMGVRNDFDANNDSSYLMSKRRRLLIDELCSKICESVPKGMTQGRNRDSSQADSFRRWFPPKLIGKKAVLDFESRDAQGDAMTTEGQVKRYLLEPWDSSSDIVTLHGIGGVGKSTIVEVLVSDDDTRKHFPDGVHLIKLGSDASSNAFLECICYILERSGAEKKVHSLRERNNIDEVLSFFMTWFEGRKYAFFIDDVWERSVNVRALSRLCDVAKVDGGNMVLITTREHEIASLTEDARIVILTPRESKGEVARKILCFHAGVLESDMGGAAGAILGILDICAGLPISLAAAGKSVRKRISLNKRHAGSVWKGYLSQLHASRQTLLRQNVGSYGKLYATFAASFEFLDEETPEERTGFRTKYSFAEMHRRLCVVQKHEAVPNRILMHLWGTESETSAEMIAMRSFVEVGLGGHETTQRDSEIDLKFSLHDSILEFALLEARRHGEVATAHNLLLEGYGSGHEDVSVESGAKTVRWWSREIEDEGYIHKQLCRHLVKSGRKKELCELLLTPAWAERQIEVNGVMYLEDDFNNGMKETTEGEEAIKALRLIRDAVTLSSGFVMSNKSEMWFQLHGRLQGYREENRYAHCIETYSAKPRILGVNRVLVGAGGRQRKLFSVGRYDARCMALFSDEELVACGYGDGNGAVINTRRSETERTWKAYGDDDENSGNTVSSIALAQNGTRLVTMSRDKRLADVWDVKNGHNVRTIGGDSGEMTCFAVTHDETCLVSVSEEGSLRLWDLRTGEEVLPAINVGSGAEGIALLKDGEMAIVQYRNGRLKFWNIRTGAGNDEFGDGTDRVNCFMVTLDEIHVVSGSYSGKVTLWDLESGKQIWSSRNDSHIESITVSKDGRRIASGDTSGMIQVWDAESGDQVCEQLKGHTSLVSEVSFLWNNDTIVSSSWDGTVRLWDIVRAEVETSFDGHRDMTTGVSFTPDGKLAVTASRDRTLRIWEVASGQTVDDPLQGHSDRVNDVAVTPDGGFVVSVSLDKTIRVWDLESRKVLHTLEGHTDDVYCVAVTPKGDRAITGSFDKTVRVWDLAKIDGSHSVLDGHSGLVLHVFVSDDGLRVISVDRENQILIWCIETERVLKTALVDDARVMSRREVFSLIGEDTVHDDARLSIRFLSHQITHGRGPEARVLATLESDVWAWDISANKDAICLGLGNGQLVFLKIDV